jgi:hypothetical protein
LDGAGTAALANPEAKAWRHHQAPDLTFDGTLISGMSLETFVSEDSSPNKPAAISAIKPTVFDTPIAIM